MTAQEGIVYILINEAMPGFVRVEFTQNNDVADEVYRLNRSSMPMPYDVYFAARVPDYKRLERTLRFLFGGSQTTRCPEFFKTGPDILKAVIELAADMIIELTDKEQGIEPSERREINRHRSERELKAIYNLHIPKGAILKFMNFDNISCTFIGNGNVDFEREEMKYSEAALRAARKLGYDWNTASGIDLWSFQGIPLSNLDKVSVDAVLDAGKSADSVVFRNPDTKKARVGSPVVQLK